MKIFLDSILDIDIYTLADTNAIAQIIKTFDNQYSYIVYYQSESNFKNIINQKSYFKSRREAIQSLKNNYKIILNLILKNNNIIQFINGFHNETEGSYIITNK